MRKRTYRGTDHKAPVFVMGHAFGWLLLTMEACAEDALDEFDERHGTRVDVVADAADLRDYGGATVEEQIDAAMACGDIRVNGGGTMVWVDPYEWMRAFPTVREARAWLRSVP